MKLLFIAPRFHSNQYGLIKKLIDEGCKVDFFVMGEGNSEDHTFVKPTVIPISTLTKLYLSVFKKHTKMDIFKFSSLALPSLRKYYNLIKRAKADAIIVRVGNYPYFLMLLPFIFLNRRKFVFYSQQPKYDNFVTKKKFLFNKIVSLNYNIPWYTPVSYYGSNKVWEINNEYLTYIPFFITSGVTPDSIYLSREGRVKILCVSKYEKRKGIEELIRAADKLVKKGFKFRLTIVGSTGNQAREEYYLTLKELISNLELDDIIELKSNIPFLLMSGEYMQNDIFVLPTTREPASISQLEAMSYGLAIICSTDNGTAHYVQDGKNGFLITPTCDNITRSIESYLRNPTMLLRHQQESLSLVNDELSIENSFQKLMALVNK